MRTRFKDLREDADLNQKQMAELLNCTQTCISKWELGQTDIPNIVLVNIAKHFNVSTDYILGLTNIKTPLNQKIERDFSKRLENRH